MKFSPEQFEVLALALCKARNEEPTKPSQWLAEHADRFYTFQEIARRDVEALAKEMDRVEKEANGGRTPEWRYIDALMTARLRCGYILNYCLDLGEARKEAEAIKAEVDRVTTPNPEGGGVRIPEWPIPAGTRP